MLRWFAERLAGEGHRAGDQRGFTLIELLVVIIIIGILAAIAIPVYLNQREKAQDAAAKSDVRNMATAQEAWLTGSGHTSYTADIDSDLTGEGFRKSGSVQDHNATANGSDSFCVSAQSKSDNWFYIDTASGGSGTNGVENGGSSDPC